MIAHFSYVICDVCALPAEVADDARGARIVAEREGFVSVIREHDAGRVKRRHDYCPAHAYMLTAKFDWFRRNTA